jgi:hypothetical protein
MNICDDGHQEICYNGNDCPLCQTIVELAHAESTRDELDDELRDARLTTEEQEAEIEALKANIQRLEAGE